MSVREKNHLLSVLFNWFCLWNIRSDDWSTQMRETNEMCVKSMIIVMFF